MKDKTKWRLGMRGWCKTCRSTTTLKRYTRHSRWDSLAFYYHGRGRHYHTLGTRPENYLQREEPAAHKRLVAAEKKYKRWQEANNLAVLNILAFTHPRLVSFQFRRANTPVSYAVAAELAKHACRINKSITTAAFMLGRWPGLRRLAEDRMTLKALRGDLNDAEDR